MPASKLDKLPGPGARVPWVTQWLGRLWRPQRRDGDLPSSSVAVATQDGETDKVRPHPRWAYIRSLAWTRALGTLCVLYVAGICVMLLLVRSMPSLAELRRLSTQSAGAAQGGEAPQLSLSLPRSFDEVRAVRRTLALYHAAVPGRLLALLLCGQIFLQTFMIPGSVVLNILGGSLYTYPAALAYSTVGSTAGAASNYLVVRWLLKDVVWNLFPSRVAMFAKEVRRHQAHLLHYMLFLRITPLFPAWFINIAAPIVEVPLVSVFVVATAVGHQPINFITIHAGRALHSLRSMHDLYSAQNVAFLLLLGVLALIHPLMKRFRILRPPAPDAHADGRDAAPLLPLSTPARQLHVS